MTKHTPGPWGWYGPTKGEGLTFTHEAHVGPGEGNDACGPIAAVSGDDTEQAVANARLVAAAPELLASCRDAYALLTRLDESGVISSGDTEWVTLCLSRLERRIELATGEEPT